MKTKLDYQLINDGLPTHKINWEKYNSENENYKTIEDLFFEEKDFIDLLSIKLTGKEFSKLEKNLFLKSLLISSMGTGYHPPSIIIPKIISSTTKQKDFAIINGLIGGLASFGTDHLGAITQSMSLIQRFKKTNKNLENQIIEYIKKELSQNKKIKGFGHPIYKKDPRPELLIPLVKDTYVNNEEIRIYETISNYLKKQKQIFPNIDSALAVSYSSLGFSPEQGIYLSFISRSVGMISHILEEFPNKPFDFLKKNIPLENISNEKENPAFQNPLKNLNSENESLENKFYSKLH